MCVWGQINPGPSSLLVEQLMALVTRRADVFKSCAALDDRAVRTPSTLQHTSLLDTFVPSRRMNFSFFQVARPPRLPPFLWPSPLLMAAFILISIYFPEFFITRLHPLPHHLHALHLIGKKKMGNTSSDLR